jgi:hypothetical protein
MENKAQKQQTHFQFFFSNSRPAAKATRTKQRPRATGSDCTCHHPRPSVADLGFKTYKARLVNFKPINTIISNFMKRAKRILAKAIAQMIP